LDDTLINKQLKVSLLINISIVWTPSVFLIWWFGTVNLWLRIEGEKFVLIHENKNIGQITCFECQLSFWEREFFDCSLDIVLENCGNLWVRCASFTPQLLLLWNVVLFEFLAVANKSTNNSLIILEASSKSWWLAITPSTIREFIPFKSSIEIVLRFVSPENWSNFLCFSIWWVAFIEWEFFFDVKNSKTLDYPNDSGLQVHSVEMNESLSTINKLLALLNSKLDTKFTTFFIISFNWLNRFAQEFWYVSLAEIYSSHKSVVSKNRHDTWNDMLLDTSSFAIFYPL